MNKGYFLCFNSPCTIRSFDICSEDVCFIKEAVKSGIPLIPGYSSVSNDAQQFRVYASDKDYPFSAKAHEEIVLIHHTDLLKGIDYWKEAAEILKNIG